LLPSTTLFRSPGAVAEAGRRSPRAARRAARPVRALGPGRPRAPERALLPLLTRPGGAARPAPRRRIEAGEIEDGSPGPSQEMRVIDPDGYLLVVARVDE